MMRNTRWTYAVRTATVYVVIGLLALSIWVRYHDLALTGQAVSLAAVWAITEWMRRDLYRLGYFRGADAVLASVLTGQAAHLPESPKPWDYPDPLPPELVDVEYRQ